MYVDRGRDKIVRDVRSTPLTPGDFCIKGKGMSQSECGSGFIDPKGETILKQTIK